MFGFPSASTNPQSNHDYVLKTFVLNRKSYEQLGCHKRDIDVIKENHKFIWCEDDVPKSWESHLAEKYYKKLFKEYCIADLSCYKKNKVALRWRTEQEVVCGKGQFQCGSCGCSQKEKLRSWEVNFGYFEGGVKRNALVKLRLCAEHSRQLNYTSRKREVKRHGETGEFNTKRRTRDNRTIKSSTDNQINNNDKQKNTNLTSRSGESKQKPIEQSSTQSDIWTRNQVTEVEVSARETDFEKYLEDLLL